MFLEDSHGIYTHTTTKQELLIERCCSDHYFFLYWVFDISALCFFYNPYYVALGPFLPRSCTSPSCFLFPFSSFVSLSHTPLLLFAAALHSSLNLIRDTCSTLPIVGPFSAKRHYDGRIVHDERCDFGHLSRVGAQQVASTTIDTSTTLLWTTSNVSWTYIWLFEQ